MFPFSSFSTRSCNFQNTTISDFSPFLTLPPICSHCLKVAYSPPCNSNSLLSNEYGFLVIRLKVPSRHLAHGFFQGISPFSNWFMIRSVTIEYTSIISDSFLLFLYAVKAVDMGTGCGMQAWATIARSWHPDLLMCCLMPINRTRGDRHVN